MGILNFWKKQEKKEEKRDYFSDLNRTIFEKKERIRPRENIIIQKIRERIFELTEELKKEMAVLEDVDLKDSKSDQRLKFIVLENLKNYLQYLQELILNLEKTTSDSAEKLINEIQKTFIDFRNRSQTSKEKSTYLIGKEIRDVKDSIGRFFKDLDDFVKEENTFFEEVESIKEAEKLAKEISSLNLSKLDLEEEKTGLENKIEEYSFKLEELTKTEEKIKSSNEYAEQLEKKEQVSKLKQKLNKELLNLKTFVDFKTLAKRYHHEEKKMNILKEYEDNFSKILSTESELLLNLIEDKRNEVEEKLESIKTQIDELKLLIGTKNPLEQIEEEKSEAEQILKESKEELEKRQDSLDKFNLKIEETKQNLNKIFEKIDSNNF